MSCCDDRGPLTAKLAYIQHQANLPEYEDPRPAIQALRAQSTSLATDPGAGSFGGRIVEGVVVAILVAMILGRFK